MTENIQNIRQRFIEAAGHMTQSLGAGRALGQVFAYLYLNKDPQSLDDLAKVLEISKGSASMTVRQLEQWGALRRIWIKGDRKDYYEATENFGRMVRRALLDMVGREMEVSDGLLEEAEEALQSQKITDKAAKEEWEFLRGRVRKLRKFRDRGRWLWDHSIIAMLLK